MYIAKQDVAIAKQVAIEKMKEFSVKIKPEDLEEYKLNLKGIAEKHSYAEEENLSFDDSDILVEAVRKMIRGMEKDFHNSPDDEKRKANVAGMILAVNDYMMALAMEALNSPKLHDYCTDELKVIYRASASRLVDWKPRKTYLVSDAFNNQRGINAEELRYRTIFNNQRGVNDDEPKNITINDLINAVKADPDNLENVADLLVEYQALAKRQENHGAIWRFFHRKENDARTALLNEMREAMTGKFSEKDLNDLYVYPSVAILNAEEEKTLKAIEDGLRIREIDPENGFGYLKYKNESKELGVEKTKVYLPELSPNKNDVEKGDKIEEISVVSKEKTFN